MHTRLLFTLMLLGALLLLSGCSSLEITATDGSQTASSDNGLSIDAEVSFSPNNPEPETRIDFTLPDGGWARLEILNVTGHRVALLLDVEEVESVYVSVRWDGTNDDGDKIKTGIYFYHLECAMGTIMKAVVLCHTLEECEDLIHDIE